MLNRHIEYPLHFVSIFCFQTSLCAALFDCCLLCFRPDLVDWRELQQKSARTRLDQAFTLMDTEYGVTRLLDPEGRSTRCRPRLTPTSPRSAAARPWSTSRHPQANSRPVHSLRRLRSARDTPQLVQQCMRRGTTSSRQSPVPLPLPPRPWLTLPSDTAGQCSPVY